MISQIFFTSSAFLFWIFFEWILNTIFWEVLVHQSFHSLAQFCNYKKAHKIKFVQQRKIPKQMQITGFVPKRGEKQSEKYLSNVLDSDSAQAANSLR